MTFYARMLSNFTLMQWAELLLRIVVAAVCGWLVGVERSRRFKDAGVRTHCMVACTAALLMLISKYGFADLSSPENAALTGIRGIDPARIAAQVVSGVSFLGAGVIYRDRRFTTRGLTTAAGIWAVAGIGMAIGAGMYFVGIFATVFIICVQYITHRFNVGGDRYSDAGLEINGQVVLCKGYNDGAELDRTMSDIEEYLETVSLYEKDGRTVINGERGKARKLSALRSMYKYYFETEKVSRNTAELVVPPKIHEKNIIRLDADEVAE